MMMMSRQNMFFSFLLLFHHLHYSLVIISIAAGDTPAPCNYKATERIAINCGSPLSAHLWIGDGTINKAGGSAASVNTTATPRPPSVDDVPYSTARISSERFSYTIPVTPGPKFLRLHFYPASYNNGSSEFDRSRGFFSVTANDYTLLSNFSAWLAVDYSPRRSRSDDYMFREFCVYVAENDRKEINISFEPSPSMPKSYAFINGLEIVSMPTDLYYGSPVYEGTREPMSVKSETALETMYRLNVGGAFISPQDDTGMYRTWLPDDDYYMQVQENPAIPVNEGIKLEFTTQTPCYVAPERLYVTARSMGMNDTDNARRNLTWILPVDARFSYVLRLHFCEIEVNFTKEVDRLFRIVIADETTDDDVDVIFLGGKKRNGIPVHKDYYVFVDQNTGSPSDGRNMMIRDLTVTLLPDPRSHHTDAILNGLEVFKLSTGGYKRSLAAPNPIPDPWTPPVPKPPADGTKRCPLLLLLIFSVSGGVTLVALVTLFGFFVLRRLWQRNLLLPDSNALPSHLCRHFKLSEIMAATKNFHPQLIVGSGGFGNVYKGYIEGGAIGPVAIKRLKQGSGQGAHEFETEIELLSTLRHLHLVSLIGYCNEGEEKILVYAYMSNGTLHDHLYKTKTTDPPSEQLLTPSSLDHKKRLLHKFSSNLATKLSSYIKKTTPPPPLLHLHWKQRLEICIGAARGLHYLHSGAKDMIIHRDVKTTNILLDKNFVAKVSDFGLSKVRPDQVDKTHVTTMVKGSIGYLDPEYYRSEQLTEKSDVYSFGVVLLEVLCGRPPVLISPQIESNRVSLVRWVQVCSDEGRLDQILDPRLDGQISPECLREYCETAMSCLRDDGIARPSMGDVLGRLEFALQLQVEAEPRGVKTVGVDTATSTTSLSSSRQVCGDSLSSGVVESDWVMTPSSGNIIGEASSAPTCTTLDSERPLSGVEAVFTEIMNPSAR